MLFVSLSFSLALEAFGSLSPAMGHILSLFWILFFTITIFFFFFFVRSLSFAHEHTTPTYFGGREGNERSFPPFLWLYYFILKQSNLYRHDNTLERLDGRRPSSTGDDCGNHLYWILAACAICFTMRNDCLHCIPFLSLTFCAMACLE